MRPFDWALVVVAVVQFIRIMIGLFTMPGYLYYSPYLDRAIVFFSKQLFIWVVVPVLAIIYRVYG